MYNWETTERNGNREVQPVVLSVISLLRTFRAARCIPSLAMVKYYETTLLTIRRALQKTPQRWLTHPKQPDFDKSLYWLALPKAICTTLSLYLGP